MKFGDLKSDPARVVLSWEDPAIAVIELVDEANKNALSPELVGALLYALDEVGKAPKCAVVVLAGRGDWFSSGAPRTLLADLKERRVEPSELALTEVLLRLPKVVICALQGNAIGGGFALAMAADHVVLSATARYGFNFMKLGITPGMGVIGLAQDFLGRPLAHAMLYSGDALRGADLPGHLVRAVSQDRVLEVALRQAYAVAENNAENVALLKQSLALPRLRALGEARRLEADMHGQSLDRLDTAGWGQDD